MPRRRPIRRKGLTKREVSLVFGWCVRARKDFLDVTPKRVVADNGAVSVSIIDYDGTVRCTVCRERSRVVVLGRTGRRIARGNSWFADSVWEAVTGLSVS